MTSLPPERFYWARLDPSRIRPRRVTHRRLGYLFESVLPVPVESVHVVYHRVDRAVVACAFGSSELESLRNSGTLSLTPSAAPEFLGPGVDPSKLELLTGPFEPHKRRKARTKNVAGAAALLVAIASVLAYGLERRIQLANSANMATATSTEAAIMKVLSPSSLSTQMPELALVSELRRLDQTRTAPSLGVGDVPSALAGVLAVWPTDAMAQTQSIICTPTTLTISAAVPDHAHAQILTAALTPDPVKLHGWQLAQPQLRADRSGVRMTIRLTKAEAKR